MAVAAVCVLVGQIVGTILFKQQDPSSSVVTVSGEIQNLTQGLHGFHIHEYGDVRNNCMSAGSHFNPFKKEHGGPDDENRHAGDFGNIVADESGIAKIDRSFKDITLTGKNSLIGRALMVHSHPDDLGKGSNDESKKTGNAGSRVDCCVIGLTKSD